MEEANRIRKMRKREANKSHTDKAEVAVQRSIVRRIAGVLASEGVCVPLESSAVPMDRSVNAWTDFTKIHVEYHIHEDDPKLTAAVMRGIFYHEGGHCRFTMPFQDLIDAAIAATGESKAVLIQGFQEKELHHAWNLLEDQRMETAVVSDSPRKAGYFTPMMLTELCPDPMSAAMNWPLMVWRRYLPVEVRRGARQGFLALYGADAPRFVRAIRQVVTDYVCSIDPAQ